MHYTPRFTSNACIDIAVGGRCRALRACTVPLSSFTRKSIPKLALSQRIELSTELFYVAVFFVIPSVHLRRFCVYLTERECAKVDEKPRSPANALHFTNAAKI